MTHLAPLHFKSREKFIHLNPLNFTDSLLLIKSFTETLQEQEISQDVLESYLRM